MGHRIIASWFVVFCLGDRFDFRSCGWPEFAIILDIAPIHPTLRLAVFFYSVNDYGSEKAWKRVWVEERKDVNI